MTKPANSVAPPRLLTGVALMYLLNRNRSRFSMDALRVLADVTLLAPVLVFQAASQTDF